MFRRKKYPFYKHRRRKLAEKNRNWINRLLVKVNLKYVIGISVISLGVCYTSKIFKLKCRSSAFFLRSYINVCVEENALELKRKKILYYLYIYFFWPKILLSFTVSEKILIYLLIKYTLQIQSYFTT